MKKILNILNTKTDIEKDIPIFHITFLAKT